MKSPFDFIAAIKANEKEAVKHLSLRAGTRFTNLSYSEGISVIRPFFVFSGTPSPFKLRVIVPTLNNCDDNSRQLDVIYKVFLSNPLDYFHHPAEFTQSEIIKPSATWGNSNSSGVFAPSLAAAYNRSAGLSGSGSLRVLFPDSPGVFRANALESAAAHSENANWQVSKELGTVPFDLLNVTAGYEHADQPVDEGRLKFGHFLVQANANSKTLASNRVSFRYGAEIQAGNEQSVGINPKVIPGLTASEAYGSVTAYSGTNILFENYSLSGSYAVRAATNGNLNGITFLKHIGYASLMAQIPLPKLDTPGAVHHTVGIEWELAGGFLQHTGTMPVSQRFFGGNAFQQLITGDDWKIPNGAFIRSIPENRLNATNTFGTPIGGSSFWSSNATFSLPVWGYPLIPRELAADPSFEPAVEAEKMAAKNALTLTYQKDLPAFKIFISNLPPLDRELAALKSFLISLQSRLPPQATVPFEASKGATDSAARVSNQVQSSMPQAASALIVGPLSRVTKLSASLEALASALDNAGQQGDASIVRSHRERFGDLQSSLARDLEKIDLSIPEKQANEELKVVDPVLHTLLHKLNIVSVSPIAVLDVARIWPDRNGTRVGPGTGVRFSLVTLNVTLGYAWNMNGTKSEGPGAMFFALDISDIFH